MGIVVVVRLFHYNRAMEWLFDSFSGNSGCGSGGFTGKWLHQISWKGLWFATVVIFKWWIARKDESVTQFSKPTSVTIWCSFDQHPRRYPFAFSFFYSFLLEMTVLHSGRLVERLGESFHLGVKRPPSQNTLLVFAVSFSSGTVSFNFRVMLVYCKFHRKHI